MPGQKNVIKKYSILKSKLVKKISETTGQQIKKEQLEVIDHEK